MLRRYLLNPVVFILLFMLDIIFSCLGFINYAGRGPTQKEREEMEKYGREHGYEIQWHVPGRFWDR